MAEPLAERVLAGDARALASALDLVEDERPGALATQRALLAHLEERTPPGHTVVGLTGPPGAGKSSLAGALLRTWTASGAGVGVVAVDPTSRRSGGALLGDRQRLGIPPGARAFARSLAARERLGGLAPAARAAAAVLRAAFEWTLLETLGVGQSEVDVESAADTVVIVLQPGSGDTLQFMKAGLLEIPDLLVVHKWDLGELARRTRADLEAVLRMLPLRDASWTPPLLGVSARSGEGVRELAQALAEHRAWLERTGAGALRRAEARTAWAFDLLERRFGAAGLERVGGRAAARAALRDEPGTALDAFSALASRAGLAPSGDPAPASPRARRSS